MTREELLLALKDISPPPEPDWWLPGSAQLGLAAVLVLGLLVYRVLRQRRRSRRNALLAGQELTRIRAAYASDRDARQLAQDLARWLKRIAMLAYPGRALAGTTGHQWLQFLDSSLGDRSFTEGCGCVFGGTVYRAEVTANPQQLLDLCERWLAAIQPRLLEQGHA